MIDKSSNPEHAVIDFGQPFDQVVAKGLIQGIVDEGSVTYSKHALEEMKKDHLTTGDILNVLHGGVVAPAEHENGSWRYRVWTKKMCVVVVIRSESELKVVTAWKEKKGRS